MKRTPQPTLTQSKLTSLLQVQQGVDPPTNQEASTDNRRVVPLEAVEMDTSPAPVAAATGVVPPGTGSPSGSTAMTADFLLKALKENSDHIIKSFKASLNAMSQRIDDNSTRITVNSSAISKQSSGVEAHQADTWAALSPEIIVARRLPRL